MKDLIIITLASIAMMAQPADAQTYVCHKANVEGIAATLTPLPHHPDLYWFDFSHTGGEEVAARLVVDELDDKGWNFQGNFYMWLDVNSGVARVYDLTIPQGNSYYNVFNMVCK